MSEARLPGQLKIVDSHTAGEPTRCVLDGFPDPGAGSLAERLEHLRSRHDHLRRAILCEPRGSDVLVGAYLVQPVNPTSATGVIFFNNAGYLGMCGHGTIGVAVTLAHMGRIQPGEHALDTPVGTVAFELHPGNRVTIRNVPAYRYRTAVAVDVPGFGPIAGDIAWGGNWFFLCSWHGQHLSLDRVEELTDFAWSIRRGLEAHGITGAGGGLIDHIVLFGPPVAAGADSKNFVLCPGKAYDRSPCGTGTSAKLACLYADGKLQPGQIWRQESITGSVFEGAVTLADGKLYPEITGHAYVNAEADLLLDEHDPFCYGIPRSWATAST